MGGHPALAALREGRIGELTDLYEPDARLDLSVPGRRELVEGRAAIRERLLATFREQVPATGWEARSYESGAAVTLERPPWRQRHYLHLTGTGIAAHWVYAAGLAAAGEPELPDQVRERAAAIEVEKLVGGGNSGAALARLRRADGERVIAKQLRPGGDWLGRALGGSARSAELWRDGVLAGLPERLDPAVIDAFEAEGSWWLLMRDASGALLGDERRLSRAENRRILALAAAMHERFRGERVPALATAAARLGIAGAPIAAAEIDGQDLLPKQFGAAWDAFAAAVPRPVGEAVRRLADDPRPLAKRIERGGTTLIHGDLRDDNLGLEGDRVVLLDWDMATAATPAVEFAWYLGHDAWRIDASHDEITDDFRAAEGNAVRDEDLAMGLICGLVMYGWVFGHSAVVHPDPVERRWGTAELDWWVPRVAEALEWTGLGTA
jgi:Phosphotransferase enzyme family